MNASTVSKKTIKLLKNIASLEKKAGMLAKKAAAFEAAQSGKQAGGA